MNKGAISTLVAIALLVSSFVHAQSKAAPTTIPNSDFTVDYPSDRAGVFVQASSWQEMISEMPTKTKAKGGLAASLSYGAVPAKVVAEYEGIHAAMQVDRGQILICICHLLSIPGEPVIVRLHPKKNSRELDGGKMIVYPVVGGSKTADANRSDLFPVDVAHPDPHVWLVRSQSRLEAGEYALMLGTTNVDVFPFTVTAPPGESGADSQRKK